MKRSKTARWQLLSLIFAVVAVAFQIPTILSHRAWSSGHATVLGHIDSISEGMKSRVIDYSYEVAGKSYHGEVVDRSAFSENTPEFVTYAPADPSVSTIQPEAIESLYITSLVITDLGVAPFAVISALALLDRRRASVESTPEL